MWCGCRVVRRAARLAAVRQIRRVYLAEIAWVFSLGKGARPYRLTVPWADAAEIQRRPNRKREAAGLPPAPARSCGRQKICPRQAKGVRVRVRALLRLPREPWR